MMLFLAEDDLVIKDQIHLEKVWPSSSRSVCCLPSFWWLLWSGLPGRAGSPQK